MAKNAETAALKRYIAEVDKFATLLRDSQDKIRGLKTDLAVKKAEFEEAKAAVREAEDVEHSTVSLLLKFITPGSIDILPLFDTMEPADEQKQGVGSKNWRKEPIAVLGLSAVALRALIDANVVLVGQLQDLLLANPDTWFDAFEAITAGMAEAIASKFHAYVQEQAQ